MWQYYLKYIKILGMSEKLDMVSSSIKIKDISRQIHWIQKMITVPS